MKNNLTNQDHINRHNELCKKVIESVEKEKTGMTSKELIQKIKDRFSELSRKGWEWQSFYNGALEGFSIGINAQIPNTEVRELEKKLDMAIEALEMVSRWKDAYPESVFPPIGKNAYYLMCGNAGYSVDRVSAHVLRSAVKGYSEIADKTLSKLKDQEV